MARLITESFASVKISSRMVFANSDSQANTRSKDREVYLAFEVHSPRLFEMKICSSLFLMKRIKLPQETLDQSIERGVKILQPKFKYCWRIIS